LTFSQNFSRLAQSRRAKRKGVLGEGNFCPSVCPAKQDCEFLPAAAGGGQSEFSVGIFLKIGSNFNQKRQHSSIFSFFRFVLRLAASRLGAERGQISETFFALRAKKNYN